MEVVAPSTTTAPNNALTPHSPLYVHRAANGFGTSTAPADCVHIAPRACWVTGPDLVVSGINNGANMGTTPFIPAPLGQRWRATCLAYPPLRFRKLKRLGAPRQHRSRRPPTGAATRAHTAPVVGGHAPETPAAGGHGGSLAAECECANVPLADLRGFKVARLGGGMRQRLSSRKPAHGETMY